MTPNRRGVIALLMPKADHDFVLGQLAIKRSEQPSTSAVVLADVPDK
jgi:hypothetical protein